MKVLSLDAIPYCAVITTNSKCWFFLIMHVIIYMKITGEMPIPREIFLKIVDRFTVFLPQKGYFNKYS